MVGYALMAAVTAAVFFGIRSLGEGLTAPAAATVATSAASAAAHSNLLLQVLVALLAVIVVSRAIGAVFRYFHQPPVIGEVLAGILLGPSVLGKFAPAVSAQLFAPSVTPMLGLLSQVGKPVGDLRHPWPSSPRLPRRRSSMR
jgi:hypothetical protein